MNRSARLALVSLSCLAALACAPQDPPDSGTTSDSPAATSDDDRADVHSHARPGGVSVKHIDLALDVDFQNHQLRGTATLDLDRHTKAGEVVLDTRDLAIDSVTSGDGDELEWKKGESKPHLGASLTVQLPNGVEQIRVAYSTDPAAAALQWLAPEQTAGGEHPFLLSQSQAILARTWVPCQDTPAVRFTYTASVSVPAGLLALMSAENPTEPSADGTYSFEMPQPIPSYLLAIAVGDLEFRALGHRAGVYAEPPLADAAAYEFEDTSEMIDTVEELYGPYRWGRYDLLVLPPSFPFGGMENPRLTFLTPTVIAGDKSLVALIAHELAHSWSGNLVTNATWNDFWLNEGFTVYLEQRIMEALRGKEYADMLALLGRQDLEGTIADLPAADTHLHLALEGRDPDEGMTDVAYEKGRFFLRMIEETVGRERFDAFLQSWFEGHAFESVTTTQFVDYLNENLIAGDDELASKLRVDAWIYGPGLPDNAPVVESDAFIDVETQRDIWLSGEIAVGALDTESWTTHEWLHFLRGLPDDLTLKQMAALDGRFGLTKTGNSEMLHAWMHHVIAHEYEPGYDALEDFLTGMGRRKFLKPLYERMAQDDEMKQRALRIYETARPGYHAVSTATIDEILGWSPADG